MSNKVFLKAISGVESKHKSDAMNKETSATGAHQFMWNEWKDEIQAFSKNPNLTRQEFAKNPDLQNKWAEYYVSNYLDKDVQKLKSRFPDKIEKSGLTDPDELRALMHYQGYPRASEYVRTGRVPETKAKNLPIPEYLKRFREEKQKMKPRLLTPEEKRKYIKERNLSENTPNRSWADKAGDLISSTAYADDTDYIQINDISEIDNYPLGTNFIFEGKKYKSESPTTQDVTPPKTEETTTEPEEEVSEWEAGARGLAQGALFGFADELTSAVESAFSGRPYREVVEETRKAYETSRKQRPGITLGTEILGGVASSFIPGVGALGRGAQIAAATTKAAKLGQTVRGGVQVGALSGLGTTEDITKPLQTTKDVISGGVIGGTVGYGLGKAGQAISESPTAQKIGKAVSEGASKVKEKLLGKSTKFQFPEFANNPQNQQRVDELVSAGKQEGLTDRQILNNIAVEFPDLSRESLESAFREKGLRGSIKRAVAGSEEATEFINRPERMSYAEEATRGKTTEMAKQESAIAKTQDIIEQQRADKEALRRESQDVSQQLIQKRQDLQQRWETADTTEKQRIAQQIKDIDNSESQLNNLIKQRQNVIDQYNQADKEIADTVKIELEKAAKSQSNESVRAIKNLHNELDERAERLAQDRSDLVENLMDIPATTTELEAAMGMRNQLQNVFLDQGLGREGSQALDAAFGGDRRFQKVANFFEIKRRQQEFDKIKSDYEWNVKNGFWDDTAKEVKPGGKPAGRAMSAESRPEITPEEIPSVGELVGALYAANQKVSSAAFDTPLAKVKRRVGEVIQEGMKDLNAEAYAIQRHLNRTVANRDVLRKSPLFVSKAVPVEGKTGRIATPKKKFIKNELPKNIGNWPTEYRKEVQNILNLAGTKSPILEDVVKLQSAVNEGLSTTGRNPRVGQLERDIGGLESKIAKLAKERQSILDEQSAKAPELKLARAEEKRGMLKEGIRSKLEIRNRLREIDDEVKSLNAQLGEQNKKLSQIGETESQLKGLFAETEGIPASMRDIGQAAVIGAKGQVPFSIGKVILPSPKTRIQTLNKIKKRFANPSLNSALRMALERPVTLETVRQLSTTHKVSEQELTDALIGAGVQIVDLLGPSTAYGSGGTSILPLPNPGPDDNVGQTESNSKQTQGLSLSAKRDNINKSQEKRNVMNDNALKERNSIINKKENPNLDFNNLSKINEIENQIKKTNETIQFPKQPDQRKAEAKANVERIKNSIYESISNIKHKDAQKKLLEEFEYITNGPGSRQFEIDWGPSATLLRLHDLLLKIKEAEDREVPNG